jgi:hypothetical protein
MAQSQRHPAPLAPFLAAAASSLAATLAGCSLAIGGAAGPTGPQADGTFVLSDQEQQRSCDQLSARSQELQKQILDVSGRAIQKEQSGSNTATTAFARLAGAPPEEAAEIAEYNRLKAESAAIDAARTRKQCGAGSAQTTQKKS